MSELNEELDEIVTQLRELRVAASSSQEEASGLIYAQPPTPEDFEEQRLEDDRPRLTVYAFVLCGAVGLLSFYLVLRREQL
jgi:hypothetical protein